MRVMGLMDDFLKVVCGGFAGLHGLSNCSSFEGNKSLNDILEAEGSCFGLILFSTTTLA